MYMSESLDKNISEYQAETKQLNPETLTNQQTIKYLQHIGTYLSGINDNIKEAKHEITRDIENNKNSILYEVNIKQKELEIKLSQVETKISDKINQIILSVLALVVAILFSVLFK